MERRLGVDPSVVSVFHYIEKHALKAMSEGKKLLSRSSSPSKKLIAVAQLHSRQLTNQLIFRYHL